MKEELSYKLSKLSEKYRKMAPEKAPLQIVSGSESNIKEKWVKKTLFYLLNPRESHGLNSDLLAHMLDSIVDDIDYPPSELSDARVEREVETDNGGQADELIWLEEHFFVCWEVKVEDTERNNGMYQTEKYAEADKFTKSSAGLELKKDSLSPRRRYYIYLKKKEKPEPKHHYFKSVSWEQVANILEGWLSGLRDEDDTDYPVQTIAQVDMFIKSIRREICDLDDRTREDMADLYVEYFEEISEVKDAK